MIKIKIYKDKQFLVFDFENGKTCKYDFATKTSIGIKGKPVKNLQNQLRGLTINELMSCCVDKQYGKFLKFVQNSESRFYKISNIGTILNRVPQYSRFEQFYSAGVEDIIDTRKNFTYSINEIPKSLIKICHKYPIKLSTKIVEYYKENPNAYCIAFNLDFISLNIEDIYDVWKTSKTVWTDHVYNEYSVFNKLISEFGYNAKDLWLYLDRLKTFEAIEDIRDLIQELYDYANMMKQLSFKFDKYPRHFLTTHKIACRNYTRMKKEFSEELFKKRIDKRYECSFGNYIFIYPDSTQDIKDEACMQSNCVASYIDEVIDGKCHILFLRKKDNPKESLVTIEVVNNKIVQAKRRFNDNVTSEDQRVIDLWNRKFASRKEIAA